jgi:hypothetical protein
MKVEMLFAEKMAGAIVKSLRFVPEGELHLQLVESVLPKLLDTAIKFKETPDSIKAEWLKKIEILTLADECVLFCCWYRICLIMSCSSLR